MTNPIDSPAAIFFIGTPASIRARDAPSWMYFKFGNVKAKKLD